MSGTWAPSVQSPWLGHTHTWNMFGWSADLVHVLDNDCQLLYKYFHIFSAVKQNNEQMRKSQSLTSWDEFPLCTVLEISHHASLQAAQTWKYFNSSLENISIKISRQCAVECFEGSLKCCDMVSRLSINIILHIGFSYRFTILSSIGWNKYSQRTNTKFISMNNLTKMLIIWK